MAKSEEFQVIVKGPGLSLDRKVDGPIARAVVGLIFGQTLSSHHLESPPGPALQSGTAAIATPQEIPAASLPPELSIAEYLKEHNADRNVDKIACIAAYLKHQRRQETFTRDDVVRMFEAARDRIPGNISRDMTWTAKIGWIATSTQNENEFYLTRSGEDVVNKRFPEDIKQRTKIGGRPAGKAKGKSRRAR